MARVTFNQPFTRYDGEQAANAGFSGTLTALSNTRVAFSKGAYTSEIGGTFYTIGGNAFGTITSLTYYKNGMPFLTIGGLSYNLNSPAPDSYFYGNDTYTGSWGSDHFYAWPGNDSYNGGAGIDTVHYNATQSELSVTSTSSGYRVEIWGKTDTLTNIERIQLGDDGAFLLLDVKAGETSGSAYRLYQAAFDRKPDTAGLGYWVNDMDKGANIQQVAQGFVDSAEFKAMNPNNDAQSIINNLYKHVLHRDADAEGFSYWQKEMANGMTTSQMLVSFSESAENINNVAADLNGGLWLV